MTAEARAKLSAEVARSIAEGDGCPTESDADLNEASRSLVAAVYEKHGAAYLWRFNPVGEPIVRLWTGDIVCNFDADAVSPTADRELLKLIGERITAPYTGMHEDARRLDRILDKLEEVGGMVFLRLTVLGGGCATARRTGRCPDCSGKGTSRQTACRMCATCNGSGRAARLIPEWCAKPVEAS